MKPFTEATSQLSSSIKSAGRVTADEVIEVTSTWPDEQQKKAAAAIATTFREHWAQREGLAGALNEYARSLAAIVEAGDQGEQSAKALAESFKKLTGAVGVVIPASRAVDLGVETIAGIYGRFARDYAARTLGEGMRQMQPFVDDVARVLEKDLAAVESALGVLYADAAASVDDGEVDGFKPRTERGMLRSVTGQREETRRALNDAWARADAASAAAAAAPTDAAKRADAEAASTRVEFLSRKLSTMEHSITLALQRLAPADERIRSTRARIAVGIELVRTARAGLAEWAAAHRRLYEAALEKRPPSVEELVQIAVEIRDLVKELRNRKEK